MNWSGFVGTITATDGAVVQVKLQDNWQILEGMEWCARYNQSYPTDTYKEVDVFNSLEEAHEWCIKRLEQHELERCKDIIKVVEEEPDPEVAHCLAHASLLDDPKQNNIDCPWEWRNSAVPVG